MVNYLIVRTLTKKVSKTLYDFEKKHPEIIAFSLSGQKKQLYSDAIKFYKDNGLVLVYLVGLKEKYPNDLEIYGASKIFNVNIPSIIKKGGRWLAQNNHNNFKFVAKNIGTTNEELEKIKLGTKIPNYEINEEILEEKQKRKHL